LKPEREKKMHRKGNNLMNNAIIKISATVLVLAVVITSFYLPFGTTASASSNQTTIAELSQMNISAARTRL